MAYSVTGATTPTSSFAAQRKHLIFQTTELEASSASEFTIQVPVVGTITLVQWELTVAGTSTTMQPTFRTATGAWDGAGAGSNQDVNQVSAAAAQGQEQTEAKYYAPAGLLYVRGGYDNAATDATGKLIIVIAEGHI